MGKATGSLERRVCPCGKTARNNGLDKEGRQRFGILCWSCHRAYGYSKKNYCEAPGCSFIAVHGVQLEVDHIDGNKRNNQEENLQTLCCNCHRLKTHANREWETRYA